MFEYGQDLQSLILCPSKQTFFLDPHTKYMYISRPLHGVQNWTAPLNENYEKI